MKFHPPTFYDADFLISARKAGEMDTVGFLTKLDRQLFQCKTPLVFTSDSTEELSRFLECKVAAHLEELSCCEHYTHFQPTGSGDLSGFCQAMMKVFPSMHSELLPTAAPPQWGMFLRGYLGSRRGERIVVVSPFDPVLKLGLSELISLSHAIDGVVREFGITVIVGLTQSVWERSCELPGFTELDPEGIQIGPPVAKSSEPVVAEAFSWAPGAGERFQQEELALETAPAGQRPALTDSRAASQAEPLRRPGKLSGFAVAGLAAAFVAIATIGFAFGFGVRDQANGIVAASAQDGILTLTVSPEWLERNLEKFGGYAGEFDGSEFSEVVVAMAETHRIETSKSSEPPKGLIPVSAKSAKR